ncbi:MAG: SoxR reducing system RseC family protein [Planctomycetes bacterium]|nr:SoxR reducing system RseC family protein [Planctomycetota bacterium]
MSKNDNCSGCPQHHDCKSMYQAIGNAEGSFVAIRSIAAFLVPILIFALGLAVFDKMLGSRITGNNARTMISVIGALLVCSIYVIALRLISTRSSDECLIENEGDEKSK